VHRILSLLSASGRGRGVRQRTVESKLLMVIASFRVCKRLKNNNVYQSCSLAFGVSCPLFRSSLRAISRSAWECSMVNARSIPARFAMGWKKNRREGVMYQMCSVGRAERLKTLRSHGCHPKKLRFHGYLLFFGRYGKALRNYTTLGDGGEKVLQMRCRE
jgi:hypothetical protein